jgi:glycosyltransferase involved in cell wall biosynthesis
MDIDILGLEPYVCRKRYYESLAEKANSCDLVHVQFNYGYFNGELPYRNMFLYFARFLKKPVILTAHEVRIGFRPADLEMKPGLKKAIFNKTIFFWDAWSRAYHRKLYDAVERVIVHTKSQADEVIALTGKPDKVRVVPHGIPRVPVQYKVLDPAKAKAGLGLSGKKVITIFGFVNKKKGYEAVLDALPGLPEETVLLIAGGRMTENAIDKEYYGQLTKEISDKGLYSRVRITGYLKNEEIPAVMVATDICLAPSSQTGSGALSLCIAYGKPIIAFDTPANTEINKRVPCLGLLRPGDPQGLSKKIRSMLDDKEERSELSGLAEDYAARYSFDSIAKETVAVYEDALKDPGRNSWR